MPSLKTIRKRIGTTKATQKITRAMKMVAGARLNRAQQRIVALRPYALKTAEILRDVAGSMLALDVDPNDEHPVHPLLARRPEKKVLIVALTSDRGLCGAFNTNINKTAERTWREKDNAGSTVHFVTVGKKGRDYLARRKATIAHDFARLYDNLDLEKARLVASWLVPKFEKGEYDAVYVLYNQFKSAITQNVTVEKLLPLDDPSYDARRDQVAPTEFLYEPNQAGLLERVLPMYIEISLYRSLLESQASEYGARMTAMDAATRNAKEMIGKLTLLYNRARQAAITKELMEIIGGAEALKE
jgi:F-type H+-transporting ATPase subunit gamma